MECLICREKIKSGEQIFFGSQGICRGEMDWECGCSEDVEELIGVIHLSCLENLIVIARTSNMTIPEPIEEESVVERSDALALLSGFGK